MVFSLKSAVKPSKRSRVLVRKETTAAYLFLLPSLIFFLGFVIFPIVLCVWTSFFDSTMNSADVFVGLANYKELFQDKVFLGALKNTLIIVVVSVPITCVFSLWVSSVIVDLKGWATSLFRIVFYLPVVTGSVAVTVVWKWMFNNYYGIFNYLGTKTGIIDQNINWLGDERYALACIILILLTTSVGQPIVLYVSALGNVDASLVEAANVDGATSLQAFWKIKWPQIMPTTLYIVVITTINSFQCFALIQLLTSGGPNHSTDTIMYYIYYSAFKLYRYGYGDAMGVVLAIMIAILSAIQFKLLGRIYAEDMEMIDIPENLRDYFDYEAYGRDMRINEDGSFVKGGFLLPNGSQFIEYYHGREDIPDEHKVFAYPQLSIREQMAAYKEVIDRFPQAAERPHPACDRKSL